MKTKRNQRVIKARANRVSHLNPNESALSKCLSTLSYRVFPARDRSAIRRKSKSVIALLEQDAAIQAERLERLEATLSQVSQGWNQPQLVLVPVEESPEPTYQPKVSTLDDGRTNYQYLASSMRIRRRII